MSVARLTGLVGVGGGLVRAGRGGCVRSGGGWFIGAAASVGPLVPVAGSLVARLIGRAASIRALLSVDWPIGSANTWLVGTPSSVGSLVRVTGLIGAGRSGLIGAAASVGSLVPVDITLVARLV